MNYISLLFGGNSGRPTSDVKMTDSQRTALDNFRSHTERMSGWDDYYRAYSNAVDGIRWDGSDTTLGENIVRSAVGLDILSENGDAFVRQLSDIARNEAEDLGRNVTDPGTPNSATRIANDALYKARDTYSALARSESDASVAQYYRDMRELTDALIAKWQKNRRSRK